MPEEAKIEKAKQILVEGNDDARLFGALAKYLAIDDVQVQRYGGYSNLSQFLGLFVQAPDFRTVESLAIAADANSNRDGRCRSIEGNLRDVNLPVPTRPLESASDGRIKTIYLVIPHEGDGTMLEDVCLESVSDDPALKCVSGYFECLTQEGSETPRPIRMPKARLHAFLASRQKPDLRLGEAADRGMWDFTNDVFSGMKELLRLI